MQTTPKVYHFSGLIAVLGLLALLVGLIVMILLPSIRYAAWLILVLGVLLLVTAFIIDFRRVSSALTGKRGRFSTGTTAMASIFIGITLLVNAISIGNYHRFDLTGVAQFTLTSQTKDVLAKLETPVQILCFLTPNDTYGIGNYITSLLGEYQNYTDQLSVEVIDPDEHPDQAREYGITSYQSVVFETEKGRRLVSPEEIVVMGTDEEGNQQIVGLEAEHAFTSAILEVTGTIQKKVYFLTGHGESSIDADYSNAKKGLLDNLYKVGTLDLMFTPSIPDDCAALIIAAPQKSLNESEVEIIENYLENGGWVMILTNPNPPQEIRQLLSPWGVDIEDGTIIDPSSYATPNIDSPSVPRTRNFFDLTTAYFPEATAVTPQPEYTPTLQVDETGTLLQIFWTSNDTQIEMYSLVWTSQDSWLEKDFNSNEEPEFDEGIDQKGPLPLNIGFLITIALPEDTQELPTDFKDTRIVVFGDSDFASTQHFYNGDNGNLFLNSVNLLTTGKEVISIDRKVVPFRRLVIGSEAATFINYSSIGLLPLLVVVVGGIIWWRRR